MFLNQLIISAAKHKKIVLIGAGNVGTRLGIALKNAGHEILQVYSRTKKSASQLAKIIESAFTNDIEQLSALADIYIIAIKDDEIKNIAAKINIKEKIIVHTSGTLDMSVLKNTSKNIGVFYPLQTLTKNVDTDFKNIPICVEASNKASEKTLIELAKSISENTVPINSKKRKTIHLAAVFANNFSNHMYAIAEIILRKEKLPLTILNPLIEETAAKIKKGSPLKIQTGPAIRGDKKIINEHIDLLSDNKDIQKIYKLITKSIAENKIKE